MIIKTSKDLKNFIKESLREISNSRDFVNLVYDKMFKPKRRYIEAIVGLRRTGKTIGLYQIIEKLNDYENTLFISLTEEIDIKDLKEVIYNNYDKKYFFIDEITLVKGLGISSAWIYDDLIMCGKKVTITGTDSYSLLIASKDIWFDRVSIHNVTFISYKEAKSTLDLKFNDYLEMGGLYNASIIDSLTGLRNYIDTSMLFNIVNSIKRNKTDTRYQDLIDLPTPKLRYILYSIFFKIIIPSNIKHLSLTYNRLQSLFIDYEINAVLDNLINNTLEIEPVVITNKETKSVLAILTELNIIIKLNNLNNFEEFNYYLTNQALFNILCKIIYNTLHEILTPDNDFGLRVGIKPLHGNLFESVIINHVYKLSIELGFKIFYYRDSKSREVDLVLVNKDNEKLLFEIKLTDDINTAIIKTIHLNSNLLNNIKDTGIIYSGETTYFTDFTRPVKPPIGKSLDNIKNLNLNTICYNVEDFILNLKYILSDLEFI